ncbi:cytochrome C [Mesorhizobium sp. LCM 4577]|uniref:Cytochrome c-like protein n=1 Tax=Mesorhizobium plurifarium TaxID=69974 RepID=A0A090DID8_MESPL|nr:MULTISPECIES: cytochrome c [unclassified Mesorhizobium]OHV66382.1 cytochrome C [Mesorhizobium sp. LCM 4577]OHV74674.1 cytochrome C [Mesorhizobium sp. LCM 4576]CDX13498.1 Cytochrome c-like protein [Mesorhizobium plurifarium]CDX56335.1 Cytochrome c-like protein [Mesorhizobium plurifarium]
MRFGTTIGFLVLTLSAAAAQQMSNGEQEYLNSCAVCHGVDGRGDGPMADVLRKRPANLTTLAKRNGGEFPYWRVYATIDGRGLVPEHGERDMPIWGNQFLPDDVKKYGPYGGEAVTTERIQNLAGYVKTLQR